MKKKLMLDETIKEEWAGIFGPNNKESEQARQLLLKAGFYVTRVIIKYKIIPEARIRGILYRGIKQIRGAIELFKKDKSLPYSNQNQQI